MVQLLTTWEKAFTFRGKTLAYNRYPYNNRAERAVEVPLAFEFLKRQPPGARVLEIGNVIKHYESDPALAREGLPTRRVVDKFEPGAGIENLDIFELDAAQPYDGILCLST